MLRWKRHQHTCRIVFTRFVFFFKLRVVDCAALLNLKASSAYPLQDLCAMLSHFRRCVLPACAAGAALIGQSPALNVQPWRLPAPLEYRPYRREADFRHSLWKMPSLAVPSVLECAPKKACATKTARDGRGNELVSTLMLSGKVSAVVLDEIANALELPSTPGRASSDTNASRKWTRVIKRDISIPGLYFANVRMSDGVARHPFRLPSVKARQLWNHDSTYFTPCHEGTPGRVETSDGWKSHPLFKEFGLKALPLSLYGDSVPYVTNKYGKKGSLVCLFFSFPHRLPTDGKEQDGPIDPNPRSWMDDIHVFTVLRKEDLHASTFEQLWDVLVWDLDGMASGVFNKSRHDGTPFRQDDAYLKAVQGTLIAGGCRFGLKQLKQDWEFLCSVYGFKSWSALEFCPFCDAEKRPKSWYEHGWQAHWRSTIWNQDTVSRALQGNHHLPDGRTSTKMKWASRLWAAPHFDVSFIKADPMHVLFVDGVVNKTIACLLYRMCITRRDLPGRRIEDRVESAWDFLQNYFRPERPPLTDLKTNRFRPSTSDGLSGISFKAKAKVTWDTWPGIHALVRASCTNGIERDCADSLDVIVQLMKNINLAPMRKGHGSKQN